MCTKSLELCGLGGCDIYGMAVLYTKPSLMRSAWLCGAIATTRLSDYLIVTVAGLRCAVSLYNTPLSCDGSVILICHP